GGLPDGPLLRVKPEAAVGEVRGPDVLGGCQQVLRSYWNQGSAGRVSIRLEQELLDYVSGDICQAEVSTLGLVGEFHVIDPHQVKERRVQIVHVDLVRDHAVTKLIGLADRNPRLDSSAGRPDGERVG